jgi:hypothetical protein
MEAMAISQSPPDTGARNLMTWRTALSLAGIATGLVVAASSVSAHAPIHDRAELDCQMAVAKVSPKFVRSRAQCAIDCLKRTRKRGGSFAGCRPPAYADPATHACIFDPVEGPEAKALAGIGKACVGACAECHEPESIAILCPRGIGYVVEAEETIDAVGPLVFCLEANDLMPTKAQARCEGGVAEALMKHVAGFNKCISTCIAGEFDRRSTEHGCIEVPPTYAKTRACLARFKARTAAAIDKACFRSGGAAPACYGTLLDSGTKWAEMSEIVLYTGRQPLTYCGESE